VKKIGSLDIVEKLLLFAGVVLILLDYQYGLRWLTSPGLLSIAAALVMEGFANLMSHQSGLIGRITHIDAYPGFARLLWIYTVFLGGLVLAFIAVLLLFDLSETLIEFLSRRPSPAFIVLSLFCLFVGGARILGRADWRGSYKSFFLGLPGRFGGVLLFALGIVLLTLGIFELASPQGFDELLARFLGDVSLISS
jgi:hypothetical protein